jgi:hypothetical protein
LNLGKKLDARRASPNQGNILASHRFQGKLGIPICRVHKASLILFPAFDIRPFPLIQDTSGAGIEVTSVDKLLSTLSVVTNTDYMRVSYE